MWVSNYSKTKKIFKLIFKVLLILVIVQVTILILKRPSNTKDWIEGISRLPQVKMDDTSFTIKDVRNWRYGENMQILSKDFIDVQYNFEDLERVWFVEEPFQKNKIVAHTFFIFDFKDQEPLGLSIEARRENGEDYDMVKGMLREYELFYNWATEPDLISIRAIAQGNPMYMYSLKFSAEGNRIKLLKSMLEKTHQLQRNPEFYNTLTKNCTNSLAIHANQIKPGAIPMHIAWLFPGYADELLYKKGLIVNDKPFEEIQQDHYITTFSQANIDRDNFSELLREKLL